MTKKKKDDKKENPPPNMTDGRSSENNKGEDLHTSSPKETPLQEISIDEDWDPKLDLLSRGIDAWIYSHFTGFFYPLTRAWAHFQAGTPLTTRRIFDSLECFARGDAQKMMDRLEEFKKFILEEYEHDPNGRVTKP
jgi:hypothetical protein